MPEARALLVALDLARDPRLARGIRRRPLPPDVLPVIRIAADDPDAIAEAVRATGEDAGRIKAAATLLVQQGLIEAGSDHYRTLGVSRTAARAELAEHVRWLMKGLHPDRDRGAEWDSALAERVLAAWNELKDPARRARYDRTLPVASVPGGAGSPRGRRSSKRRPRLPWKMVADSRTPISPRQVLLILLVCAAGVTIVLLADKITPLAHGLATAADQ